MSSLLASLEKAEEWELGHDEEARSPLPPPTPPSRVVDAPLVTEVVESVVEPVTEPVVEPVVEPVMEPVMEPEAMRESDHETPIESSEADDENQERKPSPRGARIERLDGRSIRLDDRFVLRGNGTERDPYTISWELLASASETIDAAEGRLDPPPHIALLDGAWIRIDGYYSSPLIAEEVENVLLTLNRWDGCCIGLPPSPFDCMETSLSRPINMRSKHLVRFGTVTGRMTVQPFAIGNWLMGLYRLDEAKLDMGSM